MADETMSANRAPDPDRPGAPDAGLHARIAAFLAAHTTLALATAGADNVPAVAPVFYAADDRLNLYFLSEPDTDHGRNLASNPAAAGAIYADGQDWRAIQGLQMRGWAVPALPAELAHAAAVYGRKYAFVGALLAGTAGPGVLSGPLARARFYVLRPGWLRLVDNTVAFGFKQELTLPEIPAQPDDLTGDPDLRER